MKRRSMVHLRIFFALFHIAYVLGLFPRSRGDKALPAKDESPWPAIVASSTTDVAKMAGRPVDTLRHSQ